MFEKKIAFILGDKELYREKVREFRGEMIKAKLNYKEKVERKFVTRNARDAWKGLNKMMGRNKKEPQCYGNEILADDFNKFYARFDKQDFRRECDELCSGLQPDTDITLTEKSVTAALSRINPNKAPGPDGLKGKVLKTCASQLGPVLTRLFQILLDAHIVPRPWKETKIIPVPKKPGAVSMKDFRPVALTSIVAKTMERVVCSQLTASVADQTDPMQFAYKAHRGVEDATLTLTNLICSHLDKANNYVRVLFMDFSSAFNTIQPHILLQRLLDLNVNSHIILWVKNFLSDRPQRVCVNGTMSTPLSVSTGVPQGCVISPILFSLYTDAIRCHNAVLDLIKYADDMALVGRLHDEDSVAQYFYQIQLMEKQFSESFLELNVSKTEEMVFGKLKEEDISQPVMIGSERVAIVDSFKYLGTVLDGNLSFADHTASIHKKAQQRMFLLRKLKTFSVSEAILELVYRSLIESVITFNLVTWYSHLTMSNKNKLARLITTASKVIGRQQRQLPELYHAAVCRKAKLIVCDVSHPLHACFEKLPSGRRFRVPLARKNIFKHSFIPSAVTVLNSF